MGVLALIMAGGYGKRLRPLTDKMPKAMLKVGGKPIIYWQIKWLESHGIDKFVLLGGYKAEKLISYIKLIGYFEKFRFSIESEPLGSAGAIKNAEHLLEGEDQFLVVNGDNITNIDVRKLQLNNKNMCCLALVPYRSSKGIVKYKNGKITGFEEKPLIKGYWFNAGVTLIKGSLLDKLPQNGSLEKDIFPRLAKKGVLKCTRYTKEYFNSVDSFKDLENIDKDLKSGKIRFRRD